MEMPKYITKELDYIPKANEKEVIKFSKDLNIEMDMLKDKIIQIFNTDLYKLTNKEISLYYSIYLYFVNKDNEILKRKKEKEKIEKMNLNLEKLKKMYVEKKDENSTKILLKSLDKNYLAKIISYIYYGGQKNFSRKSKNFIFFIDNLDLDIVRDIILDTYKSGNNQNIKKLFFKNNYGFKNNLLKFLEDLNFQDYFLIKEFIFNKNYKKTKKFYLTLKNFIKISKNEKVDFNSFYKLNQK